MGYLSLMPTVQGYDPTPEQRTEGGRAGATTNALNAKWSKLRQCLEAQKVIYSDLVSPLTEPKERCNLTRAWDILEERIRILRGKPLPGALKPESKSKRKPAAMHVLEPIAEPPAAQAAS